MSDDARINRLQRYTKESDRLILEEHSAGCGGIILRWRDPNEGIPIRLQAAAAVEPDFFLDGVLLSSLRFVAKTGPHILAVRLRQRRLEPRWFGSLAFHDVGYEQDGHNELIPGLSTGDIGWAFRVGDESEFGTALEQAPDWVTPNFDDSSWERPQETELPDAGPNFGHWRFRILTQRGAKLFSLPDAHEIWLRKRFVLEQRAQ